MASGLFWRRRDSSSGNANHRGCARFMGAHLCRTICDHPLKLLLIYHRCLFSESPGLWFGPASVLISQLGPWCNLQRGGKTKWQQIKHRNVKETRWRPPRHSRFSHRRRVHLFLIAFWRHAGSPGANSRFISSTLLFYKAISASLQASLIMSGIIPLCRLGCSSRGCHHGLNYSHI